MNLIKSRAKYASVTLRTLVLVVMAVFFMPICTRIAVGDRVNVQPVDLAFFICNRDRARNERVL